MAPNRMCPNMNPDSASCLTAWEWHRLGMEKLPHVSVKQILRTLLFRSPDTLRLSGRHYATILSIRVCEHLDCALLPHFASITSFCQLVPDVSKKVWLVPSFSLHMSIDAYSWPVVTELATFWPAGMVHLLERTACSSSPARFRRPYMLNHTAKVNVQNEGVSQNRDPLDGIQESLFF